MVPPVILQMNSQIRKNRYVHIFRADGASVLTAGETNLDSCKHRSCDNYNSTDAKCVVKCLNKGV